MAAAIADSAAPCVRPMQVGYAGLADAASHLRMFLNTHDTDGAVGAAEAVATATNALLGPEALLKARVTELLISLLQNPRADAQAAAAGARTKQASAR